jgi:hypothetical protein
VTESADLAVNDAGVVEHDHAEAPFQTELQAATLDGMRGANGSRVQPGRGLALIRSLALQVLTFVALAGVLLPRGRARALEPMSPDADAGASDAASGATDEPAADRSPPLESTPPIVPLAVPGYSDAVVSVPLGARSARPVVVATHGLWDFPEGLCDNWRWIIGNRAWVLCPRGEPRPENRTFHYRSGPALAREIEAGVQALDQRYPGYVNTGPRLYAGFSLGAILGAGIVADDPARYPRAVLTEGGEDRFPQAAVLAFARGGGQRVLFACGLKGRVDGATSAARRLTTAGVPARVVLGKLPGKGQFIHWYNGPVADETKAQLDWIFEGDPRWTE